MKLKSVKRFTVTGLGVIPLVAWGADTGAARAPAAAVMANNCFSCHGPDGNSPGTIPSLHRLSAFDIASLMKQFRSGERPSTVMGRHAKGYSDAEIDAIARYLAGPNQRGRK